MSTQVKNEKAYDVTGDYAYLYTGHYIDDETNEDYRDKFTTEITTITDNGDEEKERDYFFIETEIRDIYLGQDIKGEVDTIEVELDKVEFAVLKQLINSIIKDKDNFKFIYILNGQYSSAMKKNDLVENRLYFKLNGISYLIATDVIATGYENSDENKFTIVVS